MGPNDTMSQEMASTGSGMFVLECELKGTNTYCIDWASIFYFKIGLYSRFWLLFFFERHKKSSQLLRQVLFSQASIGVRIGVFG